jgi:hypothetical protein
MKKILAVICLSFLSLTFANAEVSMGISGNVGMLSADGKETITGTSETNVIWGATSAAARTAGTESTSSSKGSEDLAIGYVSGFVEAGVFGTGLRLGLSYVPYALESETTENARHDNCSQPEQHETTGSNVCPTASAKNKVSVDLEDLITMYVAYHHSIDAPFVDSFFIKAGLLQADVITGESLASGSQYGNTDLQGEFLGLGIEKNLDTGMFVRLEGNVTQFDNIKLKNTNSENTNTIDVTGLDGATATISIGKTF